MTPDRVVFAGQRPACTSDAETRPPVQTAPRSGARLRALGDAVVNWPVEPDPGRKTLSLKPEWPAYATKSRGLVLLICAGEADSPGAAGYGEEADLYLSRQLKVDPGTGAFEINDEGSPILYDPPTGLLVRASDVESWHVQEVE